MNSRQILTRDVLVLFGLAGWAMALPGFASEFALSMALTCLMYVALSSSWSLFCGTTRYLSLATSAFFGLGAYTSALMLESMSWVQVVALGAPHELAHQTARNVRVEVEVSNDDVPSALGIIQNLDNFSDVQHEKTVITVSGIEHTAIPDMLAKLVTQGIQVYRVAPDEPTLEDVYFALHEAKEVRP